MPFNPYMFNPRGFDPNQDYGITNPVPRMRQKNIFDQPTTPEDNTKRFLTQVNPPPKADFSQPAEDDTASEGSKYYDEMMRRSKPGPAVSAYQSALKEQPTDANTPVSTGRKIMATLAGITGGFAHGGSTGAQAATDIIDSPYKTAMRDYSVRMKNLGESAKLEQDDQTSQLGAMKAARDYGLKFSEYKDKQKNDEFERMYKSGTLANAQDRLKAQSGYWDRTAGAAESRAGTEATRAKDNTRNVDSEIQNRKTMAGIAQQNAGTSSRQADTAAGNLKETQSYHKDLKEFRTKELEKVPASQQNLAMDTTLRVLGQDPEMSQFVKQNDKGFWEVNDKVDKNSAIYRVFQGRVKSKMQSVLKGMTPMGDITGDSHNLTWQREE